MEMHSISGLRCSNGEIDIFPPNGYIALNAVLFMSIYKLIRASVLAYCITCLCSAPFITTGSFVDMISEDLSLQILLEGENREAQWVGKADVSSDYCLALTLFGFGLF